MKITSKYINYPLRMFTKLVAILQKFLYLSRGENKIKEYFYDKLKRFVIQLLYYWSKISGNIFHFE